MEPAAMEPTTPTEPAHRTKAPRALRPERARPDLTVKHGVGSRTSALPAATDPLLEACGRGPSEHLTSGRGEDLVAATRWPDEVRGGRLWPRLRRTDRPR